METNELVSVSAAMTGSHHDIPTMIDCWGPLAYIEGIACVVVCATVVWLAIRNLGTLFCSRQLTTEAIQALESRIAISQHMLIFLTAVWFLSLAAAAQFIVETVLLCEGRPMGEAQKAMVSLNAQPPAVIAYLLVIVAALHGAIGIATVLRKRNVKQEPQP